MDEPLSDMAFVDSQLSSAPPADAPAPAEPAKPSEPAAEVVAPDAGNKPADVVAPAGDGTGDEPPVKPEGEAPTGEGTEDEEDALEDLSVGALNKKLTENPALKAALEADPATRNLVYSALRRSAKLDQYEGIFTNPETAKFTLDTANEMVEFDRLFRSEDAPDAEQFLRALQYNGFAKDEQGNILVGDDQRPVSTGAYERIMGTYRTHLWSEMGELAKQSNDEELAEAVRIIQEKIEGKVTAPAQRTAAAEGTEQPELPDDVKRQLAKLKQFEQRDREASVTTSQEFTKSVNTDIVTKTTDEVKRILDNITKRSNIALSDYDKKNIVRDSIEAVKKAVATNPAYRNMVSTMMQTAGRNADGRAKIVNYAMSSIKQPLPKIVAKTLSEATKNVVSTAQARNEKITKQEQHREPNTTGSASTGQTSPDIKAALTAAAKTKGKPLTELEEVDVVLSLQSGQ